MLISTAKSTTKFMLAKGGIEPPARGFSADAKIRSIGGSADRALTLRRAEAACQLNGYALTTDGSIAI